MFSSGNSIEISFSCVQISVLSFGFFVVRTHTAFRFRNVGVCAMRTAQPQVDLNLKIDTDSISIDISIYETHQKTREYFYNR